MKSTKAKNNTLRAMSAVVPMSPWLSARALKARNAMKAMEGDGDAMKANGVKAMKANEGKAMKAHEGKAKKAMEDKAVKLRDGKAVRDCDLWWLT